MSNRPRSNLITAVLFGIGALAGGIGNFFTGAAASQVRLDPRWADGGADYPRSRGRGRQRVLPVSLMKPRGPGTLRARFATGGRHPDGYPDKATARVLYAPRRPISKAARKRKNTAERSAAAFAVWRAHARCRLGLRGDRRRGRAISRFEREERVRDGARTRREKLSVRLRLMAGFR